MFAGAGLVLALLACGLVELTWRRRPGAALHAWPVALVVLGVATLPALAWTALKVGALSYGGGFVIIPLMQQDAVDTYGWMTDAEFANAVAYGQLTPGPVVQTVAIVGWAAAGLGGALLAAAVAFAPSFLVVLITGDRFARLRRVGCRPGVPRRRRPGRRRRGPRRRGPAVRRAHRGLAVRGARRRGAAPADRPAAAVGAGRAARWRACCQPWVDSQRIVDSMTSDRERRLRHELHAVLSRLSASRDPLDLVEDVPVVEAFVDDFAQARIADARAAGRLVGGDLGAAGRDAAGRAQALQRLAQARRGIGGVIELRFTRDKDGG